MTIRAVKSTIHEQRLHPLPLRVMHWINAVAIFIMIGSGWKIYNDDVILGWLHFPDSIVIGKWAQYGLQWHFFGMWIFVLNGIAYLTYGIATGRFRRKLFNAGYLLPVQLRRAFAQAIHCSRAPAAARSRRGHRNPVAALVAPTLRLASCLFLASIHPVQYLARVAPAPCRHIFSAPAPKSLPPNKLSPQLVV